MKIGLSYDIKEQAAKAEGLPEDAFEEYDSPETVEALAAAISSHGHTVLKLGGGLAFLNNILEVKPDLVFNIAEGLGNYRSREAQVPSVLEMLGIPYSGSDPLTLSVCLEKPLTKQLVAAAGVATPRWLRYQRYRRTGEASTGKNFLSRLLPSRRTRVRARAYVAPRAWITHERSRSSSSSRWRSTRSP